MLLIGHRGSEVWRTSCGSLNRSPIWKKIKTHLSGDTVHFWDVTGRRICWRMERRGHKGGTRPVPLSLTLEPDQTFLCSENKGSKPAFAVKIPANSPHPQLFGDRSHKRQTPVIQEHRNVNSETQTHKLVQQLFSLFQCLWLSAPRDARKVEWLKFIEAGDTDLVHSAQRCVWSTPVNGSARNNSSSQAHTHTGYFQIRMLREISNFENLKNKMIHTEIHCASSRNGTTWRFGCNFRIWLPFLWRWNIKRGFTHQNLWDFERKTEKSERKRSFSPTSLHHLQPHLAQKTRTHPKFTTFFDFNLFVCDAKAFNDWYEYNVTVQGVKKFSRQLESYLSKVEPLFTYFATWWFSQQHRNRQETYPKPAKPVSAAPEERPYPSEWPAALSSCPLLRDRSKCFTNFKSFRRLHASGGCCSSFRLLSQSTQAHEYLCSFLFTCVPVECSSHSKMSFFLRNFHAAFETCVQHHLLGTVSKQLE